jgi:nucleoid-associated protein YgaU
MDNSRPLVFAFVIAAAIFAVVVGVIVLRGGGPALLPATATHPAGVTAANPTSGPGAPQAAAALAPPTFDIVRVDAAGTAVIAGRGVAASKISLLVNSAPLMDSTADERGEWVAIVQKPLPTGAVELALVMTLEGGRTIRSDQTVVVNIPPTRDTKPLVVLGRPGGASEVLQSPFGDDSMEFALLAIDYDDAGGVIFSGRAHPEAGVRVIASGKPVGATKADGIGRWSLTATSTLPPGRYDLQVDQLDDRGRVTAVLALPFERVTPETLAKAGPNSIIVQPGNSLWRIARRLYGSGWQYTVIYAANKTQIRDPDLIYPGQIFDVPKEKTGE